MSIQPTRVARRLREDGGIKREESRGIARTIVSALVSLSRGEQRTPPAVRLASFIAWGREPRIAEKDREESVLVADAESFICQEEVNGSSVSDSAGWRDSVTGRPPGSARDRE